MEILSDLLICAFYTLSCFHLGAILLSALGFKFEEDVPSVLSLSTTAFLLGMSGLAIVWTVVGLMALFSPTVIRNTLLVCIIIGVLPAWSIYSSAISYLLSRLSILYRMSIVWKVIFILVLILISLDGVAAFVFPPKGDAEAFYFPLAKVMAISERLTPLPGYETFSQVGLFGELHFAAIYSLGGLESAKFFVWVIALAAATMLLGIGSQLGIGIRGKLLILAILFTSSTFVIYISDGKVDLFAAALGLAAFFWALQFTNLENHSHIALVGLFTGMSIVAKLSYLLALMPIIYLLVLLRYIFTNPGVSLKNKLYSIIMIGIQVTIWTALPILPHLIKNTVLFAQPLAPFIVNDSTGNWINQIWYSPEITWWILLTYPLSLVFGEFPMQGGGLSVLLLIFVPLILLIPKPHSLIASKYFQLVISAVTGVILWNLFRASVFAPRYLLATLLVFIPIAIYLFEAYVQVESIPRWLSTSVLVCVSIVLCMNILERRDFIRAETQAFRVKNEVSCIYLGCGVWKKVNKIAEPGARIFLAGYYRYWLRPDLLQCISAGEEPKLFFEKSSSEERWIYLFEHGFHYIVWDESTHSNFATSLDLEQRPDWLNVEILVNEGANTLIHLDSGTPSQVSDYSCMQVNPPAWDVISNSPIP